MMRAKVVLFSVLSLVVVCGFVLALRAPVGDGTREITENQSELAIATFAGGCFWCMEPPFDKTEGVVSTISGYTGGRLDNPSYEQVSSGGTGHFEAIQIQFDPEKVSYDELLEIFWRNVDPTDPAGQFCDRGSQYQTAIFYHTQDQRRLADESKRKLEESGALSKPIVTPILEASIYYAAEDYHQDYYKKNPVRYRYYRMGCGRDRVLEKLWGESGH
jgi:methionine-S-sulfoxide reductase